jgi:hypothetical protein
VCSTTAIEDLVTNEHDELHRTVRAGYQRAMKKGLGDEMAFDELVPLVRAYWPDMSAGDLRKQLARMIAEEPASSG